MTPVDPHADMLVRFVGDDPHRPGLGDLSGCGLDMTGARTITAVQVVAWLNDQRCSKCFPRHYSTVAGRQAPRVGRPVRWAA